MQFNYIECRNTIAIIKKQLFTIHFFRMAATTSGSIGETAGPK